MRHPRSFTYVFLLALLLLLAVPALAAAGGAPPSPPSTTRSRTPSPQFTAQNPQMGAEFGYSVATEDGYLVVVGARYEDVDGQANAGAVYVYHAGRPEHLRSAGEADRPDPDRQRSGSASRSRSTRTRSWSALPTTPPRATAPAPPTSTAGSCETAGTSRPRSTPTTRRRTTGSATRSRRDGDQVRRRRPRPVLEPGRRDDQQDRRRLRLQPLATRPGTQNQKLTDVNGGAYQEFGASVAIEGDGLALRRRARRRGEQPRPTRPAGSACTSSGIRRSPRAPSACSADVEPAGRPQPSPVSPSGDKFGSTM